MVKIINEVVLGEQKFKVSMNKANNVASVEFSVINEPITSVDISDDVVFHYGVKSKDLLGFTILHLREFCAALKKHIKEVRMRDQEWLKHRAMESIYRAINERKMLNLYQIPKPLWKMATIVYK